MSNKENKIKAWQEELNKEVISIYHHLDLFEKWKEIIVNNKKLSKMDGTIIIWMKKAFTTDLVISLGRICDKTGGTQSLIKFLEYLMTCPEFLTRERYLNFWPTSEIFFANRGFDHLAGEGESSFSKEIILKDILKITKQNPIKKIISYRNQYLAHIGKIKDRGPSYEELNQAFIIIEEVVNKYNLLIRASSYSQLSPVMQGHWQEVFTIPWIVQTR